MDMMDVSHVNDYDKYGELELSLLSEIGSMGIGKAATALAEMIDKRISITIPDCVIIAPDKIPDLLNMHDQQVMIIYEEFQNNNFCDILLVFKRDDAVRLSNHLASKYGVDSQDPTEFIREVGNIIINNYLNAVADFTQLKILPAAPILVDDLFDAVIDVFLANIMMRNEKAVMVTTRFKCDIEVQPNFIIFLNDEFRQTLIERAKQWV